MKIFSVICLLASLVAAQAPIASPVAGGASWMPMMLVMFVVIWFFMLRPERKKQKEQEKMRNELKKGDTVVSIGGICGTVKKVENDRVVLSLDKQSTITILKSAISTVESLEASSEKSDKLISEIAKTEEAND